MIKKPILLLFHLVIFLTCISQEESQKYITSLHNFNEAIKLYNSEKIDSSIHWLLQINDVAKTENFNDIEAKTANQLAEHYFKSGNFIQSHLYNTRLLKIGVDIADKNLLLQAKSREGSLLLEGGKLPEAEVQLMEALALSEATTKKSGEIYSTMGSVFLARGNRENALTYFLKALTEFETDKNEKLKAETYSNISSLYYLSGDLDAAIKMAEQSKTLRRKIKDDKNLVLSLINTGQLYLLKNNNNVALQNLQEGVKVSENTSNTKIKASALVALSVYYMRNKMFDEAYPLQSKAVTLFEQLNDKTQLSRMYIAIGGLSNAINDSVTAINYFQKGLQFSKEIQNSDNIANAYDKISSFYFSRADYKKAYYYYKDYISIKDSILQKSNLAKINEYKINYETEKKDNEISRLSDLEKLKQLEIERQEALLKGNVAEARKRQIEITLLSQTKLLQDAKLAEQENNLQKNELAFKNEQQKFLLVNSQLQIVKQESEIKTKEAAMHKIWRNGIVLASLLMLIVIAVFFNRYKLKKELVKKQELLNIRNSISNDLHDEIGSTLTSIHILSNASEKIYDLQPAKAKEMLQKITEQSKRMQQSMSDIVWSLRSENEDIASLFIRLREYIALTTEPLDMHTSFAIADGIKKMKLPIAYRKEILLICKEAISNIIKHAGATNIEISINKSHTHLMFEISDNGKWKGTTSGTGQKSMRERAQTLGGTVQVNGNNEGTKVVALFPIP